MATKYLTITQFCAFHQCEETLVLELIDHGVCQSSNALDEDGSITSSDLLRLEKAVRLYRELGVNPAGIHIILNLLDRIEQLTDAGRRPIEDID